MDQRPIGVFDSGLGGLTTLPWLFQDLPEERIIYFGDTARTPYGSKSAQTIRNFAAEIVRFLQSKDVKLIMIACNTVSSICLPWLAERFPQLPFVGIIQPMAAKLATQFAAAARVGVIGTKVTIESGVYPQSLREQGSKLQLEQKACPVFVPLIEEGFAGHAMIDLAIEHYLTDFVRDTGLEHLVLGCTHYPLIASQIQTSFPRLHILDPSREIIGAVKATLARRGQLASPDPSGAERVNHFYASDLSANFVRMIESILGEQEASIRFSNLEL